MTGAATAIGAGAASQQLDAAGAPQLERRLLLLAIKPESNFGRAGLAHGSASQLAAGAAHGAGCAQGAGAGAAHGAGATQGAGAASQQAAGAASPLQAFLRACKRANSPSRFGAGAHPVSQAGAGAGAQAEAAGALQAALRACNRVKRPSRFGAGAHALSQAGAGAGAGAQQEAAAPLQSLLRPKIPAEALAEVAIEHPTIAKAIINRRISILQKTKGIPRPASLTP